MLRRFLGKRFNPPSSYELKGWLGVYRTPIEAYKEYGSEIMVTRTIGEEVRAGVKPMD